MNNLLPPTNTYLPTLESSRTIPLRPVEGQGKPIEEVLSFGHYMWLLKQHARKIALAVTVVSALTVLYCESVQPMYEATARITIDKGIPTAAIGQQESVTAPTEVEQLMITEIQVIQSDAVLRPVAEQLHLMRGAGSSPMLRVTKKLHLLKLAQRLGLYKQEDHFASSTREADLLTDAPVTLPNLSVARLPSSLLIDIHYRSADPRLAAAVANGIAQSYLARGMEMRARSSMGLSTFMEKQIVELKKNMDDSSRALAGYERELGVINPDEKTSIVAARLLQLNAQYTEAENDRIRKETEYRQVKAGVPSGDAVALYGAAIELSPQATMLNQQEEQLHEAEEKLAVMKTVYGPNYAEYKRGANAVAELTRQCDQTRVDIAKRIEVSYREAVSREALLRGSLAQAKDESDQLNAHSAQYQELKREAEANKTLYDELFRKIKEAGINAGFESSSIRIADEARPPAFPIFPKKSLFTILAFLLSLITSVLVVIVADMFDQSLRDPEKASRLTGVQVIGILPNVRGFSEHHLSHPAKASSLEGRKEASSVKGWSSNQEFYSESIGTLLSTVLLSSSAARLGSILITSSGPGEGKSSCAAHLALEHAGQGKKTLLIDADLRSPFQQRYFDLKSDDAMCWMVTGDAPLRAMRHKIVDEPMLEVVFFDSARNRREFKHVGLKVSALLHQAAVEGYDLVIVDAPPMLGLTEPIEIACVTDGVLVIGDAAKTTQKAVVNTLLTLELVHAKLLGLVLNRFQPQSSESYKRYKSYSAYARRLAVGAT